VNLTSVLASMPRDRFSPFPVPDPFTGRVVRIVVQTPNATDGYHTVTVRNLDAHNGSLPLVLFYTSDCLKPGFFGRGDDCVPCPRGAECPGGYRLWPLSGYWAPAEDQGFVYACDPPEACVGGSDFSALCNPAYTGEFCAQCSEGYYRDPSTLCVPCPADGIIALLLLADMIVWLGLAIAGCMLEDYENLSHVVAMIMALQSLGATGSMIGTRAPKRVREMYGVFLIFSGEYNFMKPECRDSSNNAFFINFMLQLVYNILIALVLIFFIPAASWVSQRWNARHGPEMVERRKLFYEARMKRMLTIAFVVIYYPITKNALRAFSCIPVGGKNILISDPSQECFDGKHKTLLVLSALCVACVTVGFPVMYTRKTIKNREWMFLDLEFQEAWNFMYEPLKPAMWPFYHYEFVVAFAVALCDAIVRRPVVQLAFIGGIYGIVTILQLLLRPYHRVWEGGIMLLVSLTNILAVAFNYLTSPDAEATATESRINAVMYLLILLVAIIAVAVASVVVFFIFIRWRPSRSVYGEDYFISKAVHDAFGESAELAKMYLEELEGVDTAEPPSPGGKAPKLKKRRDGGKAADGDGDKDGDNDNDNDKGKDGDSDGDSDGDADVDLADIDVEFVTLLDYYYLFFFFLFPNPNNI
jgi:heme/copper-type cytochrome/quinol oxidase subunit 2